MSATQTLPPVTDLLPAGLLRPVLTGGLIAGTLDAVDGVVFNGIANHLDPVQVLQYIASGFYGVQSFSMGLRSAAIGGLAHYAIALMLALIWWVAARIAPVLNRHWQGFGLAYGAAVFLAMNFVVLPLTNVVDSPVTLAFLVNGLISHALFVGLPIAWAVSRTAAR
jgi:uncharacterized membrane protein YagU involved in acid resistance